MKRILLAIGATLVFYSLMLLATKFSSAQETGGNPATPPVTGPVTPPSVEEGKATGGVKAKDGDTTLQLVFNAHGGDKVKGNVVFKSSSGDNFWGKVDECYTQSGNMAAFAGSIVKGSVGENYFLVEVQDNGQGKKANPDKFRVEMLNNPPVCTITGAYPATVVTGNLQVHD